ncbi:MAG: arginine--tRNA ligase, partial [Calditrichaeota bacterium]
IKRLAEYPEMISKAAKFLEPHRVTTYLMDLASTFHSFYQKHRVVTEDRPLSLARLQLVDATRQVLKNALDLLKITAPQRM